MIAVGLLKAPVLQVLELERVAFLTCSYHFDYEVAVLKVTSFKLYYSCAFGLSFLHSKYPLFKSLLEPSFLGGLSTQ